MKDVCMPVVEVSQGDFKVIYWREIAEAMNLVPQLVNVCQKLIIFFELTFLKIA